MKVGYEATPSSVPAINLLLYLISSLPILTVLVLRMVTMVRLQYQVGLFEAFIALVLVVVSNKVSRKITDTALW